jgi:glycosyltransferase involved in cell wall biosynthesis
MNQKKYPKVSHSFIRREICALERLGVTVVRYSIRDWDSTLVDPQDIEERKLTRYILRSGTGGLILSGIKHLSVSPLKFIKTLLLAVKLGYCSNKSIVYYLAYLLEACVLLEWMRRDKCTHVHVHFGTNPAQVAMFAHLLGGVSYSFTIHGPEEFDMPRLIHIKEKTRYAKYVIAISSYGRSQIFRHIDYKDWRKVKVVHCGIERSFFTNYEEPAPENNQLVCVGRLCEQKGQLLLVEAIRHVLDQGIDVKLVLAGDGEMRREIEALIKNKNLEEYVEITGWVSSEQVRKLILGSKALVLPSFAEGLPVVIMEAMALNRPVITTFVAGIPELVVQDVTGWLVPAGSVDSLTVAIEKCIKTPLETIHEMGRSGFMRVMDRHSIETEAAKLVNLFGQLSTDMSSDI